MLSRDTADRQLKRLFKDGFWQAPALFAKNRIGTTLLQELNTEEDRYRKWKEQLSAPHSTGKPAELDAARRKMLPWLRKQDLFISAALQVLLVLAHDVATQTKMAKKDIISLLSKISERVNPEVQLVSLRFLIAMSVYAENMKKFVQAGTVEKLTRILDHQRNALVTEHALKLMFNLSVCPNLRKRMVQKNVAKKLTHALETPATSELTARLLYSISIEPRFVPYSMSTDPSGDLQNMWLAFSTLTDVYEFLSQFILFKDGKRRG